MDASVGELSDAVNLLCSNCPSESERYERSRLVTEICPIDELPFYRKFFGAYDFDGTLIGAGGIKSADWASDTHILYMMAVDKNHRSKGVGSDLERIRIQWMRDNFPHGRCLVSTKHKKRFEKWDFKTVSEVNNRHLMILEF
ncbi:GNAT family N-acetyltransferase [Methylomonas sp. AM2-LC]|uniref:GNAT family N-acetyltransferase n=1 Tax=Methylomonas sp. AM2-LC TaxID=3153301 RepID=UPI00326365DB